MSKGFRTGINITKTILETLILLLLIFLLCCSCATVKKEPNIEDTLFKDEDRDWLEVYQYEGAVAKENDDIDAYHFFFWAYFEELRRLKNK